MIIYLSTNTNHHVAITKIGIAEFNVQLVAIYIVNINLNWQCSPLPNVIAQNILIICLLCYLETYEYASNGPLAGSPSTH